MNNKKLIIFLAGLLISWGIWVTTCIFSQDRSIAIERQEQKAISESVAEIKVEIKEMRKEIKEEMKEVQQKVEKTQQRMMEILMEIREHDMLR